MSLIAVMGEIRQTRTELQVQMQTSRSELLTEIRAMRKDLITMQAHVERLKTLAAVVGGISGAVLTLVVSWLK